MKKTFMALALVMAIAFISANAMARGMHGMQGYGQGMQYTNQVDAKAYQEFRAATADLRAEIAADRAEIAALMAGQNPDAKQVRTLAERIHKNMTALHEQAAAKGLPAYGAMGPGMRGNSMMGRGMGHGMGRHMMGFNGGGQGFNCPAW